MEKKRIFGELEIEILNTFKKNDRLTVRNVLEILNSNDKYTTIMTVMNRMVEKTLLKREKNGSQYEYWLNQSKKVSQPTFFDRVSNAIFGKNAVSMISYLLESNADITDQELVEMEKIIKKFKRERKKRKQQNSGGLPRLLC